VQYLPFAAGDADMATLMVLVAVQSSLVMHSSFFVNAYLINTGNTLSRSLET
jgi:hypothetical protein